MSAITPWPRAIIHLDMNAFFASIEQQDRPELRGRPIGVTNGKIGTCIITSSYEARAHGIKTGMRVKEALRLCPDFIQVPARPERYVVVSTAVMNALNSVTPDVEVFSVDEAFLDVTACQSLWGPPEVIAELARKVVHQATGLPCSVGLSGDKSTAKYASDLHKPNGLTIIPPWEAARRLRDVPVTELCGVGQGVGAYLAARGVRTCGDMARLPIRELARRWGDIGRRIWLMAQGLDPVPVHTAVAPPKSIGHGKVMPPATRDREIILMYLEHMSFKVTVRLRRYRLASRIFFIGLCSDFGWLGDHYRSEMPIDDFLPLAMLCHRMLDEHWQGQGVHQVQVTATDPQPVDAQPDLFLERDPRSIARNQAMDKINNKYGEFTLAPARLIERSSMPNVISPAWKPFGHRQTI
jgi:DNA polymerase-4